MQKRLFIDKYDISNLGGQMIVEIDDNDFSNSIIQDGNIDSFWIEKRIAIITIVKEDKKNKYMLAGIFYPKSQVLSIDELVEKINSEDRDRHYRLLTAEEVKLVAEYNLERLTNASYSSHNNELRKKGQALEK